MFKRVLALVAAFCLVAWIHVLLVHHSAQRDWLLSYGETDRTLLSVELFHYMALLVLGIPAAIAFASSFPEREFRGIVRMLERAGLWLPSVWGTLAAFCLSRWITQGAWFTDDEQAYMFQMKGYLHGVLAVPALQPEPYFHHPFVVISKFKDATLWWAGTYPIMQPLMMALSSLFGSPLISNWLCVGAIAYNGGRLTETLTGERRLGACAAWLCSTSPMLLGLASTYHTSVLGSLLSLLGVRACLSARATPSLARGMLTGALAGATFLTRSLEGTLMVVITGLVLVWSLRTQWRALLVTLTGFALSGAVALGVYHYINYSTTGDLFDTTYAVWAREHGRIMGFGEQLMWGRSHSVKHGFSQTFTILVRMNAWLFGWPSSLFIALLGVLAPLRSRAVVWLLLLSLSQLFGYFFLAWGSVHDFGTAYHVWHVPYLAAATAAVAQRVRTFRVDVPRLMLGMTLVGLLAFWPSQLQKWHTIATGTLGPIRAAEAAAHGRRVIVLWTNMHIAGVSSWVHYPPAPFPDDPILWVRDAPGAVELMRQGYPDRILLRLQGDGTNWSVVEIPR